jgi:hypothetical protein
MATRLVDLPRAGDLLQCDVDDQTTPPLSWGIELPSGIAEALVVKSGAIERLHRIGAFAGGVVVQHQGDTTQYSHSFSSINEDGTATAARSVATQKADLAKAFVRYQPGVGHTSTYGKAFVRHDLNRTEIASRVSDGIRQNVPREQVWAQVLDASLRASYAKAAQQHLLQSGLRGRFISLAPLIAPLQVTSFGMDWHNPSLLAVGMSGVGISYATMSATIKGLSMHKDMNPKDKRWSVLPCFMQPDRYALFRGTLATSKLVKVAN